MTNMIDGIAIKSAKSKSGKTVELELINDTVFGSVYYIFVDGELGCSQYGERKLDAVFNEFVTEEFDILYAY